MFNHDFNISELVQTILKQIQKIGLYEIIGWKTSLFYLFWRIIRIYIKFNRVKLNFEFVNDYVNIINEAVHTSIKNTIYFRENYKII